ncbi:MAG TPA: hypothetical protein VLH56_18815 [Dissulfurispiraceae bacterium]|nr:hypothetical protein [Dissulfurispiraceae bacterium]
MAVPMNRATLPNQYDQSISKMFYGGYTDLPSEFDKVAKVENFPKGRYLTQAEVSPLGALRQMGEGEEISFDVPAEGHKKSIQTVKFGLGFQLTEEAQDDDYHGQISKLPQSLARSAGYCRETNFFNLFNNGFSGGGVTAWDGVSVFGSHTTLKSGTTISNVGNADLSNTSLEAAFEYFDGLVDEAGIKLILKPDMLLIPTALKWVANDLLKSSGRVWDYDDRYKGVVDVSGTKYAPGTGPVMNQWNPSNGIVDDWRIMVSHYLTDDDAWFMLAPKHTFTFYWKKQPTMSSSSNFGTDAMLYKVTMRFATAVWDYKPAYGSPGA